LAIGYWLLAIGYWLLAIGEAQSVICHLSCASLAIREARSAFFAIYSLSPSSFVISL
jgi:hypothetical protein